MQTVRDIIALIIAIPALALFLGLGFLAYSIGSSWTPSDTQALITAVATICAGGMVVIGVLLALIVGVPLAIRAYGEGGRARKEWEPTYQPPHIVEMPRAPELPPVTGGGHYELLMDAAAWDSQKKRRGG